MEFHVLGLLHVDDGGQELPIGRGKEASLLALLLAHAGRPLTADRLVDELWPERPPRHAVKTIQIYVSRLRSRLGPERIATTPAGYLLRAEDAEIDALRFEQLAEEGRALLHRRELVQAQAVLSEALGLWRGEAYADFRFDPFALGEIDRLEELRAATAADLVDVRLARGDAAELIPELESAIRSRPLWERPRGQLMLALYRAGRQADALELYRSTRALLGEELGLEPGHELQALERAILNQTPEVERPSRVAQAGDAAAPGASVSSGARSVFVGRTRELNELVVALEEAADGRGSLVLLEGEPGIGKSRLAEELATHARDGGVRVLVGRCWEAGEAPAFWPWVQALRPYVREADVVALAQQVGDGGGDLARVLPDLRARLPGLPPPPSAESNPARFALFDAAAQFLRALAETRPAVLVLDDLHAGDEPSLLLLRFVARELSSMRLLILAAYRDVDPLPSEPLGRFLADVAGEPSVHRIRLRGLDAQDLDEYLERAAASIASPALAAALHRRTEGNPLFVSETVRLLSLEGAGDVGTAPMKIPDSVRDVISGRLGHLSSGCKGVLETASLLGREFELAPLAAAARLDTGALLELLDEALAARVVTDVPATGERLRFAHVLIRDTLFDALPLARRATLQQTLFAALERVYGAEDGERLAELARHALAAGERDRSYDYARRAAEWAVENRAFEEAARLYASAIDVMGPRGEPRERGELLLALGDSHARAGDGAASKASFLAAAAIGRSGPFPSLLARAALGYGGRIVWVRAGDDPRVVTLLEEALVALGDGDLELRVRLMSRMAGALRDEHSRDRRDRLSGEALRLARSSEDRTLVALALLARGHAIAAPDAVAECLALGGELAELAAQSGERELEVAAHSMQAMSRLLAGDVAGAEEAIAASAVAAAELKQAPQLWDAFSGRALLAIAVGNLDEADELVERAREIGMRAVPDVAATIHCAQRAALDDFRGQLDRSELPLRELALRNPARPVFRCAHAYALARLGLEDEASAILAELAGDGFASVPFDQEWLYALSLLAETAVLVGDAGAASGLYALLEPWAGFAAADLSEGFRGSVARYLGMLAALLGMRDAALAHYEDAVATNARMKTRPWLARTQRGLAQILDDGTPEGQDRAAVLLEDAASTERVLGIAAP